MVRILRNTEWGSGTKKLERLCDLEFRCSSKRTETGIPKRSLQLSSPEEKRGDSSQKKTVDKESVK